MAMLYLSSAVRVLEDFTYHRQFVGDNAVVLEFSAHVGTLSVNGHGPAPLTEREMVARLRVWPGVRQYRDRQQSLG